MTEFETLQQKENALHEWLDKELTKEQKEKVMELVEVNIELEQLCE